MRDVLLGFVGYVLAIAAIVGVIVLWWSFVGPPQADRARAFAFIGGGGMLTFAVAAAVAAGLIIFASTQR